MFQRTSCVVLAAVLLNLAGLCFASPVVVYENLSFAEGVGAPGGCYLFNNVQKNPENPIAEGSGDEITLVGTARNVVGFDLLLSSTAPTIVNSLTLSFYDLDGLAAGGFSYGPGTVLWSTTVTNLAVVGPMTLGLAVPNVLVPDTFIWAVFADSDVAGLLVCDTPAKGSSSNTFYWDKFNDDGQWYRMNIEGTPANFGAVVRATPEPASLLILCLGGILIGKKRRS